MRLEVEKRLGKRSVMTTGLGSLTAILLRNKNVPVAANTIFPPVQKNDLEVLKVRLMDSQTSENAADKTYVRVNRIMLHNAMTGYIFDFLET